MDHRFCRGVSCLAAKDLNAFRWEQALSQWPPVYCLGKCYMSPSSTQECDAPSIEVHCKEPIVLAGLCDGTPPSLEGFRSIGGYTALEQALRSEPARVIEEVEASMLRGRGGAGFPAGRKWRAVSNESGPQKAVIANADEGDHGSYIDRFIMERQPHRLIEALALAGYAVGANEGYIYLRKEYPEAEKAVRRALSEALTDGILGPSVMGSRFAFEISVAIGKGSYVCGEETSLINSIEHRRPEVRVRPPFPTTSGLFGMPTLVNNVETLASIPWIVRNGGAAYADLGFSNSRGTKAVSLNSLFRRPGLYEVEFGMTLSEIFEGIGGGLKTGAFKAAIIGGPLAGLIRPEEFATRFGFDELAGIGANMGHGGVVAFDANTRMIDLLAHVFAFGATESCGKCLPCRLGTRRLERLFGSMALGNPLTEAEKSVLDETLEALRLSSLCGHGFGLAQFALSVFDKFGEELAPCFA